MTDKESPSEVFARLILEADAGIQCGLSEAEALEFRRQQYGLTAQRWAMVLGMNPTHYSGVANGKRRIPVSAIERAVAVGVPAEPLLAGRAGVRE